MERTMVERVGAVLAEHWIDLRGMVSGSEDSEGYVECECGWDRLTWRVEGECRCFDDDISEDDFDVDCTCGFERLIERAEEEASESARRYANKHLAKSIARELSLEKELVLSALSGHRALVTDRIAEDGVTRLVSCSCGFESRLWHVAGTCACPAGARGSCDFDRRYHQARLDELSEFLQDDEEVAMDFHPDVVEHIASAVVARFG